MKINSIFQSKKYRGIVASIGFYLFLSFNVLVLNFIIANEISKNSLSINLAGRQRMLSQKMVKELLQIKMRLENKESIETPRNQLQETIPIFNRTLIAFESGGIVTSGTGQPVYLSPVNSDIAIKILQQTREIWNPYYEKFKPILDGSLAINNDNLQDVITYANQNNQRILSLMNSLTFELEAQANNQADILRLIQICVLLISIFNFILLLVHFVGKLKVQDEAIANYSEGLEQLIKDRTKEVEEQKIKLTGYSQGLQVLVEQRTKELEESQEKYRGIFATFPEIYFRTDMLGKVITVSPSINFKTNGFTPKDIENRPLIFLFVNAEEYDIFYYQLLDKQTVTNYDCQIRCQDKSVRSVSISARVIFKDGLPVGCEGLMYDITERKMNEEKIHLLNNELATANQQLQQQLSDRQRTQAILLSQTQKEHAINRIFKAMRNCLEQNIIFKIAVTETAQILRIDRAFILQYLPKFQVWQIITEHRKRMNLPSAIGLQISDGDHQLASCLKRLDIICLDDAKKPTEGVNKTFLMTISINNGKLVRKHKNL